MFANVRVGIAELEAVFSEAYECFVGMRNMHMHPITAENIGEIYGELSADFPIPRPKYGEAPPSLDELLEAAVAEAKKHLRLNIVPVGCLFKVPTQRFTDSFIDEVRKVATREHENMLKNWQAAAAEEAAAKAVHKTLLANIRKRELTIRPVVGKRLIVEEVEYLVLMGPKVYMTETDVHVIFVCQRVDDCHKGYGSIVYISEDAKLTNANGW